MAGNYPDAPSWLMAYDRDGTTVAKIVTGVVTQLSSGDVTALNDETTGSYVEIVGQNETGYLAFIFPEARDLDGYCYINSTSYGSTGPTVSVQVSSDTTNGLDGTWTTLTGTFTALQDNVKPAYRTDVVSATALGIRGVRFYGTPATNRAFRPSTVHLYGEPAPGANPDRLELWHPTNDEKLPPAYFDWGNVPRSSSADLPFRVKNLSASLTAGDVRVAMEALTDGSPSVPGQHTVSHNGGSFLAQVNIGDLAPGAISLAVTLRRVMASNAQLGLWRMRVFAESTDWS